MTAPRDPRTKADAIREPLTCDRWQKRTADGWWKKRMFSHRVGSVVYYIADSEEAPGQVYQCLLWSFRRWCKDAEFLGGADE